MCGVKDIRKFISQRWAKGSHLQKTEKKELEEKRALSEAYFAHSPAPMLILDFSFLPRMGKAYETSDPEQLKSRLENNRDELFAAIRRGVVIEANEASLELFGASSKEELGEQLPTIIGEKGFPSLLRGTVDLLSGKRVFETETLHRRLDGKEILIILKLAVLPGYEETLERVLATVSDITRSKELQRQLDVLSLLPEVNPDMVLVMECPDTISYVNPAARIWLREEGYDSVEELHRVLPPHYREDVCEYCDKSSTYTERLTYGERVYRFKKKPLSGAQKCMITISDVTEFERISKERELYYQAFRSSIHAMVITDSRGKIEYVNPKFEEIYGISAEKARGKTPRILNPGRETYRDLGYSEGQYEEIARSYADE
ncbi:MAG: PAS domain S-box protein [Spirochaetaceae bacterium]